MFALSSSIGEAFVSLSLRHPVTKIECDESMETIKTSEAITFPHSIEKQFWLGINGTKASAFERCEYLGALSLSLSPPDGTLCLQVSLLSVPDPPHNVFSNATYTALLIWLTIYML